MGLTTCRYSSLDVIPCLYYHSGGLLSAYVFFESLNEGLRGKRSVFHSSQVNVDSFISNAHLVTWKLFFNLCTFKYIDPEFFILSVKHFQF